MSRFSPSEAAFEGFRLVRRRPAAFLVWTLLNLMAVAAIAGLFVAIVGPSAPSLFTALRGGVTEAGPSLALTQGATSLQLFSRLAQVLGLVVLVAINCAVFRAVLDPGQRGFASIRLGADEFRVGVVKLVYSFIWVGVGAAIGVGIAVFALTAAAFAGAGGAAVLGWSMIVAVGIAMVIGLVLGVRLSLAEVMSFDSGRLQFFDSWALTRRSFWPMLGAYLLAWLMAMMVALAVVIAAAVVLAIVLAVTGAHIPLGADWASLRPVVVPAGLTWIGMGAVIGALTRVILVVPSAYIYAALTDEPHGSCPLRSSGGALML